jgi:hypothetical protein
MFWTSTSILLSTWTQFPIDLDDGRVVARFASVGTRTAVADRLQRIDSSLCSGHWFPRS